MPVTAPRGRSRPAISPLLLLVVASLLGVAVLPLGSVDVRGETLPDHLVISEVVTGGASASDELIELYNPTAEALPLEGLEVVYVSSSGLSVSRRAAWPAGAPELAPGHHVLIAHELGIYAPIADALYASGMAGTGGSVALRIQGAATAVDAVGWGTAEGSWMEGRPAPAPAPGSSLERLPGGLLGSTRDTDDNLVDFVERLLPDPQNSASPPTPDPNAPPPTPTPTPTVIPTPTPPPLPTATPSVAPTATPGLTILPVATARAMPDGTSVTIEAAALTGSTFAEGGGYVADATGGIAVLLSSGAFERGALLRLTGTIDDRFAQRTLRSSGTQVTLMGHGTEPAPSLRATGQVDEAVEGSLVRISGSIVGSPTMLSAGLAYDVNDGTGATRVVVGTATGIDTRPWTSGSTVDLVGVVGQRDSSGTGTGGYRVQPRDATDVIGVGGPTPPPGASASPPVGGSPSPGASSTPDHVVSIADARAAPKNARLNVRGTVTMPAGIVDPTSAVIQDASAAIVLRVGGDVGPLARGDRIEVNGVRSTLSGMETLRVTQLVKRLGTGPEPEATAVRTGDAGEELEARLVLTRGSMIANARRVSSGTVSFEIDDGSGPLRVYVAAPLAADPSELRAGVWVEVAGVLGQDTTGSQPLRGYRVWPRSVEDIRVGAAPVDGTGPGGSSAGGAGTAGSQSSTATPPASLASVGGPDLSQLRIGATLVAGPWAELGVGGLLWDGGRLVAIDATSAEAVEELLVGGRPPLSLELGGLRALGREPAIGVPVVQLSAEPNDLAVATTPPAPPHAGLVDDGPPRWVTAVGQLSGSGDETRLHAGDVDAQVELRCDVEPSPPGGAVSVTGIGLAFPARIMVPCGGIRPVPGLGTARASSGSGIGTPEDVAAASVHGSDEGSIPRTPAAAMLGLAGAVLGAATFDRWRRSEPDGDPSEPSTNEGKEGIEPGPDPGSEPMPRPLSLVRMPNERGSP